jgi:hypothetical protein
MTSIKFKIVATTRQAIEEQSIRLPPLDDEFFHNERGFGSLALAIPVARSENDLDIGLLTVSDHAPFSLTVGDIVRARENVHA